MSSVASSSRSSSPSTTPPSKPSKKPSKQQPTATTSISPTNPSSSKNEGTNPNRAYEPPPNALLLDHTSVDYGEFDWDAVNANEDCELWLIRIPDSIKPKYLEDLTIELPPPTHRTSTKIGTLNRKHANYDIWSIGDDDGNKERQEDDNDADADTDAQLPVVGEEIRNISCLLPRKSKKGKLYKAPKPITRRLVFSAQPVTPSSPSSPTSESPIAPIIHQNPPRQSYPKELLKHRFMPFGSEVNKDKDNSSSSGGISGRIDDDGKEKADEVNEDAMDVDVNLGAKKEKKKDKSVQEEMDDATGSQRVKKEKKSKKRKGEGESTTDSPKKTKKVKTSK